MEEREREREGRVTVAAVRAVSSAVYQVAHEAQGKARPRQRLEGHLKLQDSREVRARFLNAPIMCLQRAQDLQSQQVRQKMQNMGDEGVGEGEGGRGAIRVHLPSNKCHQSSS